MNNKTSQTQLRNPLTFGVIALLALSLSANNVVAAVDTGQVIEAAENSCHKADQSGGVGGQKVSCPFNCPSPGGTLKAFVDADDAGAKVSVTGTCADATAHCSGKNSCSNTATYTGAGAGSCKGDSDEVFDDGLYVECSAEVTGSGTGTCVSCEYCPVTDPLPVCIQGPPCETSASSTGYVRPCGGPSIPSVPSLCPEESGAGQSAGYKTCLPEPELCPEETGAGGSAAYNTCLAMMPSMVSLCPVFEASPITFEFLPATNLGLHCDVLQALMERVVSSQTAGESSVFMYSKQGQDVGFLCEGLTCTEFIPACAIVRTLDGAHKVCSA